MVSKRAMFGLGVFEAATPAPIPGCMMKNGATDVRSPMARAGSGLG
jgi:hypothetical protein